MVELRVQVDELVQTVKMVMMTGTRFCLAWNSVTGVQKLSYFDGKRWKNMRFLRGNELPAKEVLRT